MIKIDFNTRKTIIKNVVSWTIFSGLLTSIALSFYVICVSLTQETLIIDRLFFIITYGLEAALLSGICAFFICLWIRSFSNKLLFLTIPAIAFGTLEFVFLISFLIISWDKPDQMSLDVISDILSSSVRSALTGLMVGGVIVLFRAFYNMIKSSSLKKIKL
jgi:hypothetical protein